VEALFFADAHHGAGIGTVAGAAEHHLVHDGGTIHQPADGTDVGPAQGGVVEDAAVLRFPREELLNEFVAADAQRFARAVQVEPMAALVLHLGQQDGFAPQARRAGDPVALGEHAHHFAVRMLADLAHQGLAVLLRHPVLRLDLQVGVDLGLEEVLEVLHFGHRGRFFGWLK